MEDWRDTIPADAVVAHHARELGALRYAPGSSEYEILKEFEILGGSLDTDSRQQRHVPLGSAIAEAKRQLRDMAANSGVDIRVAPSLPAVEVNAAAVELCLSNLLSNGIKYADRLQSVPR